MVHSYLRHGPTEAFGLVCSASSNSHYDGKLAYVPALEDVLVWDVKKGQMLAMWHETGHRAEVTCILRSPQKDAFAVGYADGSIRLWSASSTSVIATFNGHKKAVTALAFDETGTRLASGSQDTDLILWDVVGETGLYRLRGHRDQITAIRFIRPVAESAPATSTGTAPGFLLTASKDTFLKLWDLSTQHCIQTVVAHRSEVWTMDLDPEQELVFTGSGEGEMKAWKIDHAALGRGLQETDSGEVTKFIHSVATLPLASSHRVSQITFHPHKPYLAVQSHDKSVEVFRIRTEEEIKKKQARRRKRAKEKEQEKKEKGKKGEDAEPQMDAESEEKAVELADLFQPYLIVRASGKVRSFGFGEEEVGGKGNTQLFVALANNALEVYNIPPPTKSKDAPPEASRVFTVDLPGHRTDVRTLCLSSDDALLASASNGSLKIWNMKTIACIRTMDCGYAICSTFLPGDRQVAVGTKSGEILIYDIASSSLVDTVQAHSGTVWSIHVRPDGVGLVSGSADKDVKFWDFERKPANSDNPRSVALLTLVHIRTLKMTDDVLCVRYSPNGKLLAVALLDSTVKVFYQDTLKFFLSLYGHKLPVLSMDISGDSKLIVTCSADKNVKIWGLDFGDCHKSLFAHDESVMQVAFERNDTREGDTKPSHYFWTVGKDKLLKYWDGDRFENIQKLEGHHGEVWALAVSHHGKFVVTGSHDKSIRVWEKLDEPLFLEEERERELEALYEGGIADSLNQADAPIGSGVPGAEPTDAAAETTGVSKQTTETLMAGERIMEALELADNEIEAFREYEEAKRKGGLAATVAPPPRNPVLAAYDVEPEEYVLKVVQRVPGTALYDALLVLPFGKVVSLMRYLNIWAQREWNIVLTSRIIFFLLKTHHHQIVANRVMRTALIPLRRNLREGLRRQKETIGYNLAALRFIQRQNDARRTAEFFEQDEELTEEQVREKIAEGGKKRKRVNVKT
ncbi:WD40 repeat-like protein [Lentinus tigrinus ALCF2SS1-7]|uniref:WD40 repeat-like protein n=1 Tax=Lentinus tigrinus ALCF2SS1-6 TaxID=1328759 RepID=A0A5C2SUT5_9APHY|nr:WD40 repeat-like protein [Lentinus tigrinus ALCF2SS1-6]RPD81004.1 WD40 repeat-like protein [Lentinus tigrinus ALCF2SS1-7]